MALDALELQLASARQRFLTLQRRATTDSGTSSKVVMRALKELEEALEELRVAQENLLDGRRRMEELQGQLIQQQQRYWQLFDEMPQAYLVTRDDTTIVEANRAAAELLNVSQRFLPGKVLSVFVCENRSQFLSVASRTHDSSAGTTVEFKLRPRERAPLDVRATVSGGPELRWVLSPSCLTA